MIDGQNAQSFQPNSFAPAMLKAIDFYHFLLLSMPLTLARDHFSTKDNALASFSQTFQHIRMESDMAMKQLKLNILTLFLSETPVIKGNSCCFTECTNNHSNVCMHSDVYEPS